MTIALFLLLVKMSNMLLARTLLADAIRQKRQQQMPADSQPASKRHRPQLTPQGKAKAKPDAKSKAEPKVKAKAKAKAKS